MRKTSVWILALLIRCVLIWLGTYISDPPALSMTDIDYLVVWDGVCLAPVPSERPTYRYSPIFKVICWPMCRWPTYGKVLYSLSDLIFALLAYRITRHSQRVHHLWLMNPFVIALSVRGSFDSIVQTLVAWMLLTIKQHKYLMSGLLLGLCIHLRIYPIIFTPFLLLYALLDRKADQREPLDGIFRAGLLLCCTLISFFATTLISMLIDDGYLSSGLLYHVSGRVDHRHNLSILWAVQLACSKGKEVYCWPFAKLFQTVILAALIIQRVLALRTLEPIENEEAQSVLKRRYFYHQLLSDLDQACRAFVAFNSVVTAQYFSWTFATFTLSPNAVLNKTSYGKLATFVGSLGLSLCISGALEFSGKTKYLSLITLANTAAMGSLLFL
ncbi:Dolichyl-phosphate-mannose-protein mannosyltransferase [Giardia duodenalis]|uniref:GPI mannosyltransferase 1 n=1 Tax=Giardia intestinalis (strain ATCC 50803 / WB clone C6) TaxID=184922 RepID=A0A644EZP5_GIAIC|nr:Dolichyl-phosphate-mannose-protein mannosyltransferase [Giardia intestinalis]KAE8301809.1 Dolichyl-phosphate-mannose-protein mannosyltransferase [Giardia intestinalis]